VANIVEYVEHIRSIRLFTEHKNYVDIFDNSRFLLNVLTF
jgi:hypothetical protein